MKSVILYGGSFNPPHYGHIMVVAIQLTQYDEVWIIPTKDHPFGKELSSFQDRFTMTELAFAKFGKNVKVLDLENNRKGPSRTYDTVKILKNRYPDIEFSLLIGEDNLKDLPKWHKSAELQQEITIKTIGRGKYNGGSLKIPDISSSYIRSAISSQSDISHLTPSVIVDFIKTNNLYSVNVQTNVKWGIIGTGRAGSSIVQTLINTNNPPSFIVDPKNNLFVEYSIQYFEKIEKIPLDILSSIDLLFIAIPDHQFPSMEFLNNLNDTKIPAIVTTGGMKKPSSLFPKVKSRINKAILHPALSISSEKTDLSDTIWGFCGDSSIFNLIKTLFSSTNSSYVFLEEEDLLLYHSIASILANGVSFLSLKLEQVMIDKLGFSQSSAKTISFQLLSSILSRDYTPPKKRLTGPLVRGDMDTVFKHADILGEFSLELKQLYLILSVIGTDYCDINILNHKILREKLEGFVLNFK